MGAWGSSRLNRVHCGILAPRDLAKPPAVNKYNRKRIVLYIKFAATLLAFHHTAK